MIIETVTTIDIPLVFGFISAIAGLAKAGLGKLGALKGGLGKVLGPLDKGVGKIFGSNLAQLGQTFLGPLMGGKMDSKFGLTQAAGRRAGQGAAAYFDEVAPDSTQFERIGSPAAASGIGAGNQEQGKRIAELNSRTQRSIADKQIAIQKYTTDENNRGAVLSKAFEYLPQQGINSIVQQYLKTIGRPQGNVRSSEHSNMDNFMSRMGDSPGTDGTIVNGHYNIVNQDGSQVSQDQWSGLSSREKELLIKQGQLTVNDERLTLDQIWKGLTALAAGAYATGKIYDWRNTKQINLAKKVQRDTKYQTKKTFNKMHRKEMKDFTRKMGKVMNQASQQKSVKEAMRIVRSGIQRLRGFSIIGHALQATQNPELKKKFLKETK